MQPSKSAYLQDRPPSKTCPRLGTGNRVPSRFSTASRGCATKAASLQPTLRRRLPGSARWFRNGRPRKPHAQWTRRSPGRRGQDRQIFCELADVAIAELIPQAMQGQKRVWGESQEYDPFAGLCEKRPVRVLAGLRYELHKGADVALAWSQFLYSAGRQTDNSRVAVLIARRLATLPQPALDAIIMPASYWLESAQKRLYERDPEAFRAVYDKLVYILAGRPASTEPKAPAPGQARDWANFSFNSAAGRLVEALCGDPRSSKSGRKTPCRTRGWRGRRACSAFPATTAASASSTSHGVLGGCITAPPHGRNNTSLGQCSGTAQIVMLRSPGSS